jgi:hypothetical protein
MQDDRPDLAAKAVVIAASCERCDDEIVGDPAKT